MKILDKSVQEMEALLRTRKICVRDILQEVEQNIASNEQELHAYLHIDMEAAYGQAKRIQEQLDKQEEVGSLAGIPVAVKDNILVQGMPMTCGSKILDDFMSTYNATVIEQLQKAGAIIIGKTNMDEFAMGSTTETSAYGVTKNPRNVAHVPGGSSGGSAAAVASGECVLALGSDTGGSIRMPAAYCGITGLKPSYGSVSRYGLTAYASSMDQIGPMGRSIEDCAVMLDVISGHDAKDSTSMSAELCKLQGKNDSIHIAIPREYMEAEGLSSDTRQAVEDTARLFAEAGYRIDIVDIKYGEYVIPTYYTIACAEAASNLARYDGVKYGYRTKNYVNLREMYNHTREEGLGYEVKKRIMLGNYTLSEGYYEDYYLQAAKVRRLIQEEYKRIFRAYDLILGPTTPTTAPKLGAYSQDDMSRYLCDLYGVTANLTGMPALSMPMGVDTNGLPIGIQLMADRYQDKKMLHVAMRLENMLIG